MKTVYIVYNEWYSEWTHCCQRSVDAIFETFEDAEYYVNQIGLSNCEIEEFSEYYEDGYKNSKS